MERACYKIAQDKPVIFDDEQKQKIFEFVQNKQHIGKEARKEHKQNVIAYKEKLEEMKRQKVCPYCKTPLVSKKENTANFTVAQIILNANIQQNKKSVALQRF